MYARRPMSGPTDSMSGALADEHPEFVSTQVENHPGLHRRQYDRIEYGGLPINLAAFIR